MLRWKKPFTASSWSWYTFVLLLCYYNQYKLASHNNQLPQIPLQPLQEHPRLANASEICATFEHLKDTLSLTGLHRWCSTQEPAYVWLHYFGAWASSRSNNREQLLKLVEVTKQSISLALHSVVWHTIATSSKNQNHLFSILFEDICIVSVGILADVIRTCLHGFGHGLLIRRLIVSLHLTSYSACTPIRDASVRVSNYELQSSVLLCEQINVHVAHACASGAFHAFFIFDDRMQHKQLRPDFWPCQSTRYPSACLIDYIGISIFPPNNIQWTSWMQHNAALSTCTNSGALEVFRRACIWHLSDTFFQSSGETPYRWCSRFFQDSSPTRLDRTQSYRWLACIRGLTGRGLQLRRSATEITAFCKEFPTASLPELNTSWTTQFMCMQAVWFHRLNPLNTFNHFRIYNAELFLGI